VLLRFNAGLMNSTATHSTSRQCKDVLTACYDRIKLAAATHLRWGEVPCHINHGGEVLGQQIGPVHAFQPRLGAYMEHAQT
jgi:hypothetical protein